MLFYARKSIFRSNRGGQEKSAFSGACTSVISFTFIKSSFRYILLPDFYIWKNWGSRRLCLPQGYSIRVRITVRLKTKILVYFTVFTKHSLKFEGIRLDSLILPLYYSYCTLTSANILFTSFQTSILIFFLILFSSKNTLRCSEHLLYLL